MKTGNPFCCSLFVILQFYVYPNEHDKVHELSVYPHNKYVRKIPHTLYRMLHAERMGYNCMYCNQNDLE